MKNATKLIYTQQFRKVESIHRSDRLAKYLKSMGLEIDWDFDFRSSWICIYWKSEVILKVRHGITRPRFLAALIFLYKHSDEALKIIDDRIFLGMKDNLVLHELREFGNLFPEFKHEISEVEMPIYEQ